MDDRQSAGEIENEAARWVVRLDRAGHSPSLKAELAAWLGGDRRRQGALLRAEAAWALLDDEQAQRVMSRRRLWTARTYREAPAVRWFSGALAAALALLAIFIGLHSPVPTEPALDATRIGRYSTGQGEVSTIRLPDGSRASMNALARLTAEYRPDARSVRLEEGQAWFDVAKDPSRAFLVSAGEVRVQAIGTGFAVDLSGGRVEVSVTEGTVDVWTAASPSERTRLDAGFAVIVSDEVGPVENRGISQIEEQLQWRVQSIDLRGQTLRHAVEEFNRNNARQIEIADPRIADEPLHGVFRLDDPGGFAGAIGASLDVPVDTSRPDRIRLGVRPMP